MKTYFISLIIIVASLGAANSLADTPITTPLVSTFCSQSGRFCAKSKASSSTTLIEHQGKQIWSVNSFVPYGFISDDGAVIASCYPGKNMVPNTANLSFTVIKLFDRHGRSKSIVLGDLYGSMRQLPETESHKEWGRCVGFHDGYFEVERADGSVWKMKEHW